MGKEYSPALRNRAVGMVFAGQSPKSVGKQLGISRAQLHVWLRRAKAGEELVNKPGRGRKPSLHPVAKRVIALAANKRHQSTRKLAFRLTRAGYTTSKSSVHRHLRGNLGLRAFKLQKRPKLTEKQRMHRLKFAKDHKKWTENDWKRVMWSDESPFELFHAPNRQNDRVWASDSANVPAVETVKNPQKVHVWGMMSHCALSDLHVVPLKTTINGQYYRENILAKQGLDAVNRTATNGSILERKLVENQDEAIFMQDGAPPHTAKATQQWCRENLPGFWEKDVWPGNSPDLNPIENIWSIMQQMLDQEKPATSISGLVKQIKRAWASIRPSVLANLVAGVPNRMRLCIAAKGGYVGK